MTQNGRNRSFDQFLVGFCEFSGDDDLAIPHRVLKVCKRSRDPVGCLEEHNRTADADYSLEPFRAVFRPSRWKPQKREAVFGHSRGSQSRQYGAWPRNRLDPDACVGRRGDKAAAGIGNSGRAGIRNDCDVLTSSKPIDEHRCFRRFVVLMQARCRRPNRMTRKQASSPPRILSRDDRHFTENSQRPKRDVFQISDGRGNDEQRAGHYGGTFIVTFDGSRYVIEAQLCCRAGY